MALWLFRRRSRRKRPRQNHDSSPGELPLRSQTVPQAAGSTSETDPPQRVKRQHTEPNKLQRRARAYSFSPERGESLQVSRRTNPEGKRTSLPQQPLRPPKTRRGDRRKTYGDEKEAFDEDTFPPVPRLYPRPGGRQTVSRKKSSKRRKPSDQAREAELKETSSFKPLRPATEEWGSGRPLKKETRRVSSGLTFGLRSASKTAWEKDNEHRLSEVSLPIAGSIHSSLSTDSDQMGFKVSAFDALAPRPTLRFASQPRWSKPGSADGSGPQRSQSVRKKISLTGPIPEATLKAHKRIDDLADELTAGDLRELMERDRRRRERKKQLEQERVERRLARRAEKQKEEQAAAEREGRETPQNLERGVLGRELIGLGIDTTSAVVMTSSSRSTISSPERPMTNSAIDDEKPTQQSADSTMTERPEPVNAEVAAAAPKQSPAAAAVAAGMQRGAEQVPQNRSSYSRPSQPSGGKAEKSQRRASGSGPSSKGISWSSLFRWARKQKPEAGPSSFSNTSRDSMNLPQQPMLPPTFVPRKPSSGMPRRTMSRFREDLPELPLSPPRSRTQTPEAGNIPPTIAETSPIDIPRAGTPGSGPYSGDGLRQTPSSWSRIDEAEASSPQPQSMSLASIDSEGSWLSGRMASRKRPSTIRDSLSRHHQREEGDDAVVETAGDDDPSLVDDEYLSSYAGSPGPNATWKRKSAGEPRPSSDEDEPARWGAVQGRQPLLVQSHAANHVKSREVLLNTQMRNSDQRSGGDGDSPEAEITYSPLDDDSDGKDNRLQRATSVQLGKGHVRHISAGSARLLELTPRSSVDAKRRSLGSPKPA